MAKTISRTISRTELLYPRFARGFASSGAWAAFSAAALLLAACATTPTRYFTLRAVPARRAPARLLCPAVAVAPIAMPPGYSRLAFIYAGTGTRIHVARHARWVAPLGTLLRRAIAQDMAARISPRRVVRMPGQSLSAHATVIRITVERFLPKRSGEVILRARWSARTRGRGSIIKSGAARISVRGADRYGGEAQTMSRAAASLARRIVESLSAPGTKDGLGRMALT